MAEPARLPPPDAASLHEAAVAYLARYAATEASLRRILDKRIDRWARLQPDEEDVAAAIATAREAADAVVAALARSGAVSDTGFAETRARSLLRSGRSQRAIQARLLAKGVPGDVAQTAAGDDAGNELAAALILARRRRIGPFRTAAPLDMAAARRKELGMLARAGFTRTIAERALDTDAEEAEVRIRALRSDQVMAG